MIIFLFSGCSLTNLHRSSVPATSQNTDYSKSASLSRPLHSYTCTPTDLFPDCKTFSQFCDYLFQTFAGESGISLHYTLLHPENYHITDVPDCISDFSIDHMESDKKKIRQYLTKLQSFDYQSLTAKEQLTFDILYADLEDSLKLSQTPLCSESLAPQGGDNAQLPVLLAEYTFTSKKDVEQYLKLLASVKDYFHELIRFEQLKAEKGYFMSDKLASGIISQCQDFIKNPESNYLISVFDEKLDHLPHLTDREQDSYKEQNKDLVLHSVIPAYESLIQGLTDLKGSGKNSGGLCHFKDGKTYYEQLVRSNTGSSKTLTEIKDKCTQELKSYITQASFFASSKNISSSEIPFEESDPKKILEELKNNIKKDFPEGPDTSYTIKHVNKSLEASLNPAFYMIPPIDDIKNNCIYINDSQVSKATLYTTLAHEGYPGHLYQTTYFANTNPDLIRYLLKYSGYSEGWATYVEYLSYDFAPSDKKTIAALTRLNSKYSLALSCLVDIGINYDGWSLEQTKKYLSDYGIIDASSVETLYEYVISQPAEYLSYYVGYLEFEELKETAKKTLGKKFSLKEFHKFILTTGPCQFDVLKKYLDIWMAS